MRKTMRRTCLLLVLCLILGMLPMGTLAEGTADSVKFQSQYLVLNEHLVMHFELSVPDGIAQNAQVNLTVADKTVTYAIGEMAKNESGNYEVSVELAAAQMTEKINASVVANGETLAQKTYSVHSYAKALLNGNYTAEAKTLVKYLLNYGAKAQAYFHVNENDLADAGISGLTQTDIPADAEPSTVSGSVSGLTYYGSSLLFSGKLATRFYFATPNGVAGMSFAANEKELAAQEKNGLYYVDVEGIYPQNIDRSVALTVNSGEETLTVTYGPMNYISRMYPRADESLKDLLQALYDYHIAAKAYTDGGKLETTYPAVLPSYEENRADQQLEVVAFWMPPVEENQYQWLQEAGVTSLIIDNQYNTSEGTNMRKALSLCDAYDIHAYISIARESANYDWAFYLDMYTDHPSFTGYFIDEPITKTQLDNVFGVAKYAYEHGCKLNVNLLCAYTPSNYTFIFDTKEEYQAAVKSGEIFASYDAYIQYAIEGLKPYGEAIQLATCNYSLMDTDASPSVASSWLTLLGNTYSQAQELGADVWQFVASSGYVDHRQVTEADLRWQYYTALAYGMTGIENFVWESLEPGGEFEEGDHGPIWYTDVDDTSTYYRSDVYYALQNVTNEIGKFDHVLLSFDWQGVMVNATNSNTYTTAALKKAVGTITENRRITSLESTRDLLVGCFLDENNYDGFLIVNFDETANGNAAVNNVSITFDKAVTALAYVGGERQVVTLTDGTYSCQLKPGEAVFVIPVEGDMEAAVEELVIPQNALLVENFSDCANVDGVAGVKILTDGSYTDLIPENANLNGYTHLTFRLKAQAGSTVVFGGQTLSIPDRGWTDVSVELSKLSGWQMDVTGKVYMDQIYATAVAQELPIPEGAVLVTDFSTGASPWNNGNYGSGAIGVCNWYAQYDGVAGVQAFGFQSNSNTMYTGWTAILPDFDYSDYTHITFRLKANKDVLRAVWLTDFATSTNILEQISASNEWVTVTLKIEDLPGMYMSLANTAGASGEMIWLDQVYVQKKASELPIPDGAVLVTDFSTAATPWQYPNYGSGSDGLTVWHEEYDGVAGVQAFGFNAKEDWSYAGWTAVLPDFDYSDYTHITFRLKANKDVLRSVALADFNGNELKILDNISASNEWVTVTLKISDIPNFYLTLANTWGASGEVIWLDQVYVEKKVEEVALPEGAVLVTDFSTAATPWNHTNWGSGAVGISNWYAEYDGVAGVQAFGFQSNSNTLYTGWTAILPDFDYSDYTHISFRMKANKDVLRAVWLTDFVTNTNILDQISASNEWVTVTLKIEDLPGMYMQLANTSGASGEMIWLDQVYVETRTKEVELPEGAVLVTDFSTAATPWNHPNWGSGAVGMSNWYEEYDGVAGVQALGFQSNSDTLYTGWTAILPDFDYSDYTYITFRLKANKDVLRAVWLTDFVTNTNIIDQIPASNEWVTVTLKIEDLPGMYMQLANTSGASGEMIWLDQVYVSNYYTEEPEEPTVEELPISDHATMYTDYSESWTPWVKSDWGSHDLTYSWYETFQGHAGVMGSGSSASGNNWNWFNLGKDMNFTDAPGKMVVIRLYATNPILTMGLWATGTNKSVDVSASDIPTNEWYDLRIDITDIVEDGVGTGLHLQLGTSVAGQTVYIDQIFFIEEEALPDGATLISDYSNAFTPWNNPNWGSHNLVSTWHSEFQGHSGVLGVGAATAENAWNHFSTDGSANITDGDDKELVIRYYATKAPIYFAVYGTGSKADVIVDVDVSAFKTNEWAELHVDLNKFFEGQDAEQVLNGFHIRLGSSTEGEFFYMDQVYVEIDQSAVWEKGTFNGENVVHYLNKIDDSIQNRIDVTSDSAKLYLRNSALDAFQTGDYIQVSFEIHSNVTAGEYSTMALSDSRKSFDGQFIGGQWYDVTYFAEVASDADGKYVELGIQNANGQAFYLRNLQFANTSLEADLFGGVTVEMLTNMNVEKAQMNSFLITDGEYVIVMDGGYPTDDDHLYEQLKNISANAYVDGWFISHAHSDHFGALLELLKDDKVTIGTLYYRFPTSEERNGNNEELDYQNAFEEIVETRIAEGKIQNVVTIGADGVYTYGKMTVKTLNDAYFGGSNFLNDSTIVMKLETPKENVLFLGDLGERGDVYLADSKFLSEIADCSVVQLAHHGQNGVTEAFYKACTSMKIALYCAPAWLWNNDNGGGVNSGNWNTLYVRQWLRDMGVGVSYYLDGTDLILT